MIDYDLFLQEDFLNGLILCVTDATFENFKKINCLYQYLQTVQKEELLNVSSQELIENIEHKTQQSLYLEYQKLMKGFQDKPSFMYIYCFADIMRIQVVPILYTENEIHSVFKKYVNWVTYPIRQNYDFQFDIPFVYITSINSNVIDTMYRSNSLLIVPNQFISLNLLMSSHLKEICYALQDFMKDHTSKKYYGIRFLKKGIQIFESDDERIDKISLLFDSTCYLDETVKTTH